MTFPDRETRREPSAEPFLKAPWVVLGLIVVLVGVHGARMGLHVDAQPYYLTSEELDAGRWTGLVSYMFVHGNWAHVVMNSVFILAFGAPVARYLGSTPSGALLFLGFFLSCGVLAGLAFGGLEQGLALFGLGDPTWAALGASGAASGLMGAAARLIEGRGRLGSMTGRTVIGMTIGWMLVNAVLGVSGLTPGAEGAPVAWEAHIFGYLAGLLLIGLFGRLAGVGQARAFTKR